MHSLLLAPGVDEAMLSSSFWITRAKNPDKVKKSLAQIALWNEQNISDGFCLDSFYDLQRFDSVVSAEEIRNNMVRYQPDSFWYKKVVKNGSEEISALDEADWRVFYKEMNYAELGTFA